MRAKQCAILFPDPYLMIQDASPAVPRRATALSGPLQELERHFLANQGEVEPLCIQATRSAAERLSALATLATAREQRRVLEPRISEIKTAGSRQ